mmetsp:Transcript_2581/g.8533  ORF Transcript_2581/g.8533 Transcript_2581/m.8533 type:complete len:483 (+) Transcript_2581:171-1619(+)
MPRRRWTKTHIDRLAEPKALPRAWSRQWPAPSPCSQSRGLGVLARGRHGTPKTKPRRRPHAAQRTTAQSDAAWPVSSFAAFLSFSNMDFAAAASLRASLSMRSREAFSAMAVSMVARRFFICRRRVFTSSPPPAPATPAFFPLATSARSLSASASASALAALSASAWALLSLSWARIASTCLAESSFSRASASMVLLASPSSARSFCTSAAEEAFSPASAATSPSRRFSASWAFSSMSSTADLPSARSAITCLASASSSAWALSASFSARRLSTRALEVDSAASAASSDARSSASALTRPSISRLPSETMPLVDSSAPVSSPARAVDAARASSSAARFCCSLSSSAVRDARSAAVALAAFSASICRMAWAWPRRKLPISSRSSLARSEPPAGPEAASTGAAVSTSLRLPSSRTASSIALRKDSREAWAALRQSAETALRVQEATRRAGQACGRKAAAPGAPARMASAVSFTTAGIARRPAMS